MIAIILIGILAVIVLTIAAIETKRKQEIIDGLNKNVIDLSERNFELALKLEESNEMLCDERDKVKRLEETMLTNAASMSLQRYDVVPLVEHIDVYPYSNKPIFEFGKLTKHGRKVAVSAFKGMVNDICADDEKFDSFVDVFISNDESGVDVYVHMVKC